jgi:hypothetical protein
VVVVGEGVFSAGRNRLWALTGESCVGEENNPLVFVAFCRVMELRKLPSLALIIRSRVLGIMLAVRLMIVGTRTEAVFDT